MTLPPGARLGPYEIIAPLGAGGMGEVYRARDTRLDRTVAIKIAAQQFSERFEREARAVSTLNHPHICTLHDIGHQDGVDFLVMEYLEGETLSSRLDRGPLPPGEALRYAGQIAAALADAHSHEIFHRDLKPGNIMLTKGGAKLLDFGLAKLPTPAASEVTQRTADGTILGTLQYMAPEQLEGKETDARADLFAFGAVLLEMLTGRKAFPGKTQASVVAGILERDPLAETELPAPLARLLRACLTKDLAARWQSAHDLALELQWLAAPVAPVAPSPPRPSRRIATVAVTIALAILAAVYFRPSTPDRPVTQLAVLPPDKAHFSGSFSVSPDGRRIVLRTVGPEGRIHLVLRSLDAATPQPIPGADGASFSFWSPDSRYLGFFAEGKLKRVELAAGGFGPVQTISDQRGQGGTWNAEGTILYGGVGMPIRRVPASGGQPADVTRLDAARQEQAHRFPQFLPDGRRFLFLVHSREPQNHGLYAGDLGGAAPQLVLQTDTAAYYSSGHLFFLRDGRLLAQRFDPAALRLTGDPVVVSDRVASFSTGESLFAVSANGLVVYRRGSSESRKLVWTDRQGKELTAVGDTGDITSPALSPDPTRLAFDRLDLQSGNRDLWVVDLTRGAQTRFTFDRNADHTPIWSPDGLRIAFSSNRTGVFDLYWKDVNGVAEETLLAKSDRSKWAEDWSPDGRWIAFSEGSRGGALDLWVLPVEGDRRPLPLLETPYIETSAVFSPDGRLFAYSSDESGSLQVYVRTFTPGAAGGGKWQVSTRGGAHPRWRRDGKELFYIAADYNLMGVPVKISPTFEAGLPQPLFPTRTAPTYEVHPYTVSADGQKFLVNRQNDEVLEAPTLAVVNWQHP